MYFEMALVGRGKVRFFFLERATTLPHPDRAIHFLTLRNSHTCAPAPIATKAFPLWPNSYPACRLQVRKESERKRKSDAGIYNKHIAIRPRISSLDGLCAIYATLMLPAQERVCELKKRMGRQNGTISTLAQPRVHWSER